MTPTRIQRQRRKGWRKPPGAINVARPSKWSNPHDWQTLGREEAVRRFEADLNADADRRQAAISELRGKDLMCWCPIGQPCHADVLLKIANGETP